MSVVGVYTEAALERKLQDVGKQSTCWCRAASIPACRAISATNTSKACDNGFSTRLSSPVGPIRLTPAKLLTSLLPNTMFPSSG